MGQIMTVLKTVLFISLILSFLCHCGHAEIYKYKDENGVWCYTDNPIALPEDSEEIKAEIKNKAPEKDLQKQLSVNFPQRNEIESATCGVVAVKSPIGFGSGFFITNDGYILTNKHVLKGDENQRKIEQFRMDDIEEKIKRIKKNLDMEEERLKVIKAKLEKDKQYIDSMPNSSAKRQNLKQYESYVARYKELEIDFNTRKRQFKTNEIEINEKISDYNYNKAIADISRHFKILVADNTEFNVYLVSTSRTYDLALLKLDGYKTPFLKPAHPDEMLSGETVYAVGNPAKLRNSVAKGIISGFEGHLVKTDAKIYPGNSGGPLITEDGKVIGINTFKELTRQFEGLGFAISIDTAINEFKLELEDRLKFE